LSDTTQEAEERRLAVELLTNQINSIKDDLGELGSKVAVCAQGVVVCRRQLKSLKVKQRTMSIRARGIGIELKKLNTMLSALVMVFVIYALGNTPEVKYIAVDMFKKLIGH